MRRQTGVPEFSGSGGPTVSRAHRVEPFGRVGLAIVFAAASLVSGCDEPTEPPPPAREISPPVRAHLEEVIDIMERHAVNRMTIDWDYFRSSVYGAAAGAQPGDQTYYGVLRALHLLNDRGHSRYISAANLLIQVSSLDNGRNCLAPPVTPPTLPPSVGYIHMGRYLSTGAEANTFADSIHAEIRNADREGLVGWIVDLRGNTGGNMWPMLTGLGPILGDGIAGYFVDPAAGPSAWRYSDGASIYDGTVIQRLDEPYRLRDPMPRVAVLFDGLTASSGEAMVLAFRGRPGSRSFGAPSCGIATGVAGYPFSNGATLGLASVWIADRDGNTFPAEIDPDEPLPADQVITRAVEWLTSEPEQVRLRR